MTGGSFNASRTTFIRYKQCERPVGCKPGSHARGAHKPAKLYLNINTSEPPDTTTVSTTQDDLQFTSAQLNGHRGMPRFHLRDSKLKFTYKGQYLSRPTLKKYKYRLGEQSIQLSRSKQATDARYNNNPSVVTKPPLLPFDLVLRVDHTYVVSQNYISRHCLFNRSVSTLPPVHVCETHRSHTELRCDDQCLHQHLLPTRTVFLFTNSSGHR